MVCSIVKKSFRTHLRSIKPVDPAYLFSRRQNSIFKILINRLFWRDDFENQFIKNHSMTTTKMLHKFDSKLISPTLKTC